MSMCTRASTGISVLILNAFSSMVSECVSAYAKTPQNLIYSLTLYTIWMSRREDPSDIFNMLLIGTAIDFFSFLLSLLIFFSAVEGLHPRILEKVFAKNI